MVLIQSVNYYNHKNLSERTISHSGLSLIILKQGVLTKNDSSLSFLLQKNDGKGLKFVDKETGALEILINFTFLFWNQSECSIPLRVTKELQQITQLLFTYYIHGKLNYPVDKVIFFLVERIIKLNSDVLNGNHSFLTLIKFMEDSVYESLRVSDFCSAMHLSEASLNRLCHKHTGTTMMRLFRKIQCWEAERLMSESSLTIQEISLKLGYKDSKSFSTMYRRNEGISPMEKRKKLEELLMDLNEKEIIQKRITSVLKEIQILTKTYNFLLERLLEVDSDEEPIYYQNNETTYKKEVEVQNYIHSKSNKKRGYDYRSLALVIASVLKESGKPLSTKQIYEELNEMGYKLNHSNLSNNILYKINKDSSINVERACRGYWQYRLKQFH